MVSQGAAPPLDENTVRGLLERAFRTFVANYRRKGRPLPSMEIQQHTFRGVGTGDHTSSPSTTLDIWEVLKDTRYRDISSVRELVQMVAPHMHRSAGMKITVGEGPVDPKAINSLMGLIAPPILRQGLELVHAGATPERAAELVARRIVADLCGPSRKFRFFAYIENFDAAVESFQLTRGLHVRRLEEGERSLLVSQGGPFGTEMSADDVSRIGWVVEKEVVWPISERDPPVPERDFQDVLLAAHLHKNEKLNMREIHRETVTWHQARATFPLQMVHFDMFEGVCRLSQEEVPEFIATYGLVAAASQAEDKPTLLALARFRDAFSRTKPDDQLIDYVIALEAILLAGVKAENRFRFAQRGALFLVDDLAQRVRTFAELKAAYDARSEIVHGAGQLKAGTTLATTRRHARQAILRALKVVVPAGCSQKKAMELLDEYALEGASEPFVTYLRRRLDQREPQ